MDRRRHGTHYGLLAAMVVSGLVFARPAPILGQAEPAREAQATNDAAAETAKRAPSLLDVLSPTVVYMLDRNGDPVPVRRNAELDKWLQSLQHPAVKPDTAPAAEVASITLTGTADDERAVLTAKFVIRVPRGEETVSVSLGLNEAVLRSDYIHDGPGEFGFDENHRTQGKTWWVRGKGDHHVTLDLFVPVKKQGSIRRLQLSLPDAAQSRLTLTTKFPATAVKSAAGEVITNPDQPSQMELLGLGTRVDLTWQPSVAETPTAPLLEAETVILAYAGTEELLIEAHQRVNVVQGSITEFTARLPKGAKLESIDGRDVRGTRPTPNDPERVTVQLLGPNNSQTSVIWRVRLQATEQRRFVLDGFVVESARKQSGKIGLIPIEDLRLSLSSGDHPQLMRTNPAELRPLAPQVSSAYRFFSQPLRAVLSVDTVEPYFTCEPRLTLHASLEDLTLEGLFSLNVLRGKLRAVEIDWPNAKTDGWLVDWGELVEAVEDVEGKPGRVRLKLAEDHSDQFVLRLKAQRTIPAGQSVPFSLPQLVSPDSIATSLKIVEAENMTTELTPIGETLPELQSAGGDETALSRKTRTYRLLSGEKLFSLRTVRQSRRVHVHSTTSLELDESRLRSVQTFQFDVDHERLAQFRLALPEGRLPVDVSFLIDPDRSLAAEWSTTETDGLAVAKIVLPEPRIGRFTVQAVFELPLSDAVLGGASAVDIPILNCLDYPVRQYELKVVGTAESHLTTSDALWKPRNDVSGGTRWVAEGAVNSVRMQWESDGAATQQILIHAADLRAEWDRQGAAFCEARYRLSGVFPRLTFVLPPESTFSEAAWDGRPLLDPVEVSADSRPRHYTVRVRSLGSEPTEHELTIQYRLAPAQSFGLFNRWTLLAPQFPQARWLAQATWDVRIPSDQHLFAYAPAVTPKFQWERRGVVWSRISPPAVGDAVSDGAAPRNRYAFEQFGEVRELPFSTMSGAMILLVGASISLLVGFLVLNVAGLRNLMTLWGGLFAVAVAGLWFRPQLEVLLQPILLGFLFPLAAVWLQSLRRTETPPVMSFDPLMDLVEARSSVTRARPLGEPVLPEPVLVRSPTGSTHDFLRSEAGSGVP